MISDVKYQWTTRILTARDRDLENLLQDLRDKQRETQGIAGIKVH